MIEPIDLKRLRNAELIQLMKNCCELVQTNGEVAMNVENAYQVLAAQTASIESLFKLSQANELSEEILALDLRRDNAITGLGRVVDGYLLHYDEGLSAAAKKLSKNLALYGNNIAKENYQSETATIRSIVNDWNGEALSAAVDTLRLTAWLVELSDVNTLFDQKYLARTQEYGAVTPEKMQQERLVTYQKYYDLRDRIAALHTITPTELLQKTINEINALIDQYNTTLAHRAPAKPGSEESPSAS